MRHSRHRCHAVYQRLRPHSHGPGGGGLSGCLRGRRPSSRKGQRVRDLLSRAKPRDRAGPQPGHRRADPLLHGPPRRWSGLRGDCRGLPGPLLRRGRLRAVLSGLQRALLAPLRRRSAGSARRRRSVRSQLLVELPLRAGDAGLLGSHVRHPLHARVRRHHRRLRPGVGGRPGFRGHQPLRPLSSNGPSPWKTTRTAAGSWSRCASWTAARRPTVPRPCW